MKKIFGVIFLSSIMLCAFGQDTLELEIRNLAESQKFKCKRATSMDVCRVNIYHTNQTGIFYKINYDYQGRIHSQGAVIKEEINEYDKRKTVIEYFATGIWQYYNYAQNEIVYFECVYSNTPGCRLVSKDEIKREKIVP